MIDPPQEHEPDLPIPEDDGACDHLVGKKMPALVLSSTEGPVDLAMLARDLYVVYLYPRTGVPSEPPIAGWDTIPGARGCTVQSCAYRDHHAELVALGARVAGVSAQSLDEQLEFAMRSSIPFPLISDPTLRLASALGLPTFSAADLTLYKRVTLIAERGRLVRVFYPVFPPEANPAQVLAWLAGRGAHSESD